MKIGLPSFIAKMPKAISKASSGAAGFKSPSGIGGSLLGKSSGKLMAFVLLAFVIGAVISQGSYAFADDSATNPFRAIWEAIGELQTKTDSLQEQIDELKTQDVAVSSGEQLQVVTSDTSLSVDVGHDDFQTIIDVVATNTGEDHAVGVKILTYYQTSVLDVTFIDGAQCTDQARGIIECYVGTIESGGETHITIYADPVQLDEQAIVTADVSSITKDANPENNHAELVFVTSEEPAALPPQQVEEEQPSEETPSEEQPSEGSSEETSSGEQPSDGEQGSGEQAGEEQSGDQSSSEQGSEDQSSDQGSGESSGESSSDQGSESGGSEGGSDGSSSDSGSSEGGSSGGDSGSSGGDSGSSG